MVGYDLFRSLFIILYVIVIRFRSFGGSLWVCRDLDFLFV